MNYNIPQPAIDLMQQELRKIQKHVPSAVITGGFIRDSILGKKPKDIDIFFGYVDGEEELDYIMEDVAAVELEGATYMPQDEVSRIWDCTESKLPVQYIMLQQGVDFKERVEQYDFGFCQCWYDGVQLHTTEAFRKDIAENSMTLTFCEDSIQYNRSMRRAARFKEKYPDRRLVVPDQFKKLGVLFT